RAAELPEGAGMGVGRREDELVVVAAGKHAAALGVRLVEAGERLVLRNALVRDAGADGGALEEVAQVAGEAVRDIDGRARDAAQPLAEGDPRLGPVQPPGGAFELRVHEGKRRAAHRAGDPDAVARPRAG